MIKLSKVEVINRQSNSTYPSIQGRLHIRKKNKTKQNKKHAKWKNNWCLVELPKRLSCGYAQMFQIFLDFFLALFSSVQKCQNAQMLCTNVEMNMWGKLRKIRKAQNSILDGGDHW